MPLEFADSSDTLKFGKLREGLRVDADLTDESTCKFLFGECWQEVHQNAVASREKGTKAPVSRISKIDYENKIVTFNLETE